MILVFDTETSGKAHFQLPPEDIRQPRLVQLGCAIYDFDGVERSACNLIVGPDETTLFQDEAVEKHGISKEISEKCGVPLLVALTVFQGMLDVAELVVAHNYSFDKFILHGELSRMWQPLHIFLNRPHFCTMLGMTPICRLPGGRDGEYKWPKLQEAYQHFFGEEFSGAHDALSDVRSCARIFHQLKILESKRQELEAK